MSKLNQTLIVSGWTKMQPSTKSTWTWPRHKRFLACTNTTTVQSSHLCSGVSSPQTTRFDKNLGLIWSNKYAIQGTATNHGLSTSNARAEGLQSSPLYGPAFKSGKRCAILCTGFYEWKTIDGKKQPFFFHLPQETGIYVDDQCGSDEDGAYHGPRPIPLAGVFNHWRNAKGQLVPNVAVVTMASGKWLSWCHHRMPVILDTPEKLDVRMTEMTEINLGCHVQYKV